MQRLWEDKPNLAVPWYLMASYLYYIEDESLMSDHEYDTLCCFLNDNWEQIEHRHKLLIDREILSAGSGFDLRREHYPYIVMVSAWQVLLNKSK